MASGRLGRLRNFPLGATLKRITVLTAATALVLTGCAYEPAPVSEKVQAYYDENVANRDMSRKTAPPAVANATTTQISIGILSDSHAFNEGSWWRKTVVAGGIPGAVVGPFESQPGANTAALLDRAGAAAEGADFTVIQAGTNDLLSAATPTDVLDGVKQLSERIIEGDSRPIIALLPPSDTRGELVLETNALLREFAEVEGFPVIDVTSPVMAEGGMWKDGLSTDGIHANSEGSALMTEAAVEQIPSIIN